MLFSLFRNIAGQSTADSECMIQWSLWQSLLAKDQQFCRLVWQLMAVHHQISLSKGKYSSSWTFSWSDYLSCANIGMSYWASQPELYIFAIIRQICRRRLNGVNGLMLMIEQKITKNQINFSHFGLTWENDVDSGWRWIDQLRVGVHCPFLCIYRTWLGGWLCNAGNYAITQKCTHSHYHSKKSAASVVYHAFKMCHVCRDSQIRLLIQKTHHPLEQK